MRSRTTLCLLRLTDWKYVARPLRVERRAPAARLVAGAGPLDLDHVGAEVGQHHRRERAGQDPREVEDPQRAERGVSWGCRPRAPFSTGVGMTTALATVFAAPGAVTGYAAIAVAALMLALWLVSIPLRDVSIVDPAWGPAFVLVAAVGAVAGDGCLGPALAAVRLTAVWGLRLGAYLLVRKLRDRGEDRRYAAMRERRGSRFVPWSLVCDLRAAGAARADRLPAGAGGGRAPAACSPRRSSRESCCGPSGFAFESIGDEQLRRFKARADNRGQVMDRGLWRYTRHPNYFGDFCVWWGLWLVALTAGGTWWTVVGPVVMSTLLIRVSGAGLLEKDIGDRRPGYADYVRRTSGFFPWPPKKSPPPAKTAATKTADRNPDDNSGRYDPLCHQGERRRLRRRWSNPRMGWDLPSGWSPPRLEQVVADPPAVPAAVAPDHLGGNQEQPPRADQSPRLALASAPTPRSTSSASSARASRLASHASKVRA